MSEPIASTDRDLPPPVGRLFESYVDESLARDVRLVPLAPPVEDGSDRKGEPAGVLIVESFSRADNQPDLPALDDLAKHSALALQRIRELSDIPLVPVLRKLKSAYGLVRAGRLHKTILAVLVSVAVVLALTWIETDFRIEAPGTLQPTDQRHVFAPSDGTVRELAARHGLPVRPGQVLARLDSPRLELQIQQVSGELQAVQERLAALESARLVRETTRDDSRRRPAQLSAEESELKEQRASLRQQLEILRAERELLTVTSPIAGQVLTWEVERLLQARPVRRGQILLTVADVDGPWELVVRVPDRRVRFVVEAREGSAEPLVVDYVLGSDTRTRYRGTLERLAESTTEASDGRPGIRSRCAPGARWWLELRGVSAGVVGGVVAQAA
jgi:hypothetical protein